MKVRLTVYGLPFGRTMNYEVAQVYYMQARNVIKGLSWKVVDHG